MAKTTPFLGITCAFLVVISLFGCRGPAGPAQEEEQENGDSLPPEGEEIPEDQHPVIDGVIGDQEWQGAKVDYFADGSEIFLIVSGNDLFLAVRAAGAGMIAGNVFISSGDQVAVLHTSAALGTAFYQQEGDLYRKVKDFEWCCRSRIDDQAALAAREAFYAQDGWLGVNSFLGNQNELEYKITLEEQSERLAVNYVLADGSGEKLAWPVSLQDGVAQPTSEGFPDLMGFNLEAWLPVRDIR